MSLLFSYYSLFITPPTSPYNILIEYLRKYENINHKRKAQITFFIFSLPDKEWCGDNIYMNILMVSSEAVPFSKSGGLADVVGALSSSLHDLGHKVTVFMPLYSFIDKTEFKKTKSFLLPMLGGGEKVEIYEKDVGGVLYAGLSHPYFTHRKGIYGDTSFTPYSDNCPRFIAFSKAAALYIVARGLDVDIVHCHDWTTGFVPHFLRYFKVNARTVYTIHNLDYQGVFPPLDAVSTSSVIPETAKENGQINMMALAIRDNDRITTVSPSYAKEILTPQLGSGLENLLKQRESDTTGILNGIDTNKWNPEKDSLIPSNFSISDMSGKKECKRSVQRLFNLEEEDDVPLIALITRLAFQKGFEELLMEGEESALERILKKNVQVALIGTGDSRYISRLSALMTKYQNLSIKIIFSEELSHSLEAGADFFLMPSKYEPCGLNQMYSLAYGTIPIVHSTGGLKDTVLDIGNENGNGISFSSLTPEEIVRAVERALSLYNDKTRFENVRREALKRDFSWHNSALKYEKLYYELLKKA